MPSEGWNAEELSWLERAVPFSAIRECMIKRYSNLSALFLAPSSDLLRIPEFGHKRLKDFREAQSGYSPTRRKPSRARR